MGVKEDMRDMWLQWWLVVFVLLSWKEDEDGGDSSGYGNNRAWTCLVPILLN